MISDYYFVEMSKFESMIAEGGFLEHAQFSGNRYGTRYDIAGLILPTLKQLDINYLRLVPLLRPLDHKPGPLTKTT